MTGGPSDATEEFWQMLGVAMIVLIENAITAETRSEGREVEFCTIAG